MSDRLTPAQRSAQMSGIRGKNTAPELLLRSALHRLGVRYRIHSPKVFGRPDVSHAGAKVAVFVDGCFWHGCPTHYIAPANRTDFWQAKLNANLSRRSVVVNRLTEGGWRVLESWECAVERSPERTAQRIAREIEQGKHRRMASLLQSAAVARLASRPRRQRSTPRGNHP